MGQTGSAITVSPAMVAAKRMKKIHDQLEESGASKHLEAAFEMALFGTGVMKGPFAVVEMSNWNDDGEYDPMFKVPQVSHVSVWNFYQIQMLTTWMAQYVIERHKMSRSQLRALKKHIL